MISQGKRCVLFPPPSSSDAGIRASVPAVMLDPHRRARRWSGRVSDDQRWPAPHKFSLERRKPVSLYHVAFQVFPNGHHTFPNQHSVFQRHKCYFYISDTPLTY